MANLAAGLTQAPPYRLGVLALSTAAAVIAGALAFEHIGGYAPCPLCLQQRYAYYGGVPALFLALVLVTTGQSRAAGLLFLAVCLAFLGNAVLAGYHSGVEWGLWLGPDTCAAGTPQPLGSGSGGILDKLSTTRVIRCDEAAWRFLGLSLAGWNVLASLFVAAVSLSAALKAWRT